MLADDFINYTDTKKAMEKCYYVMKDITNNGVNSPLSYRSASK